MEENMKYMIIGGVAGGATTAARLRRNDESAEIIIFERGAHISYANCGLPYYIGSTISERDKLFVQTPESFKAKLNIEVRVRSEVTAIDPDAKKITVKNLDTDEEYTETYDKLVLSPGAEPVKPPIPGINEEGIFTLRSVPETDAIKSFVDDRSPKRAVIVGAGFIGLEMAENLHQLGLQVTIVEMAQQVMNVVDYEIAAEVHQHLKTKNVEFYLSDGVASFRREGERLAVTLKSGREIETDMVILSIGVRPESKLAREAGLEIGRTGGIKVDKYLRTSNHEIYAVGDAIEFENPITGSRSITYLAGPANKQGRICADNIAHGDKSTYKGSIATAVAKVFDLTVASTGVSEKTLTAEGIPFLSVITHSSSHAGYYPGASPMSIKTLYSPSDGRLFGAQIVGYEGVDKRIDLFATVLRCGGTVWDLGEVEHAYAPPYSSAKDPVNIAGFVAQNTLTGVSQHIHWNRVEEMNPDRLFLLDVRTPEEAALGMIEGAVNIPDYELRQRLSEVPKDKTVIVYCAAGQRAYFSERILRQTGYEEVYNLSGGYKTYEISTQRQANEDIFAGDYLGKDDHLYQADPERLERTGRLDGSWTPEREEEDRRLHPAQLKEVDASGMQCPGPIMKLKQEIEGLETGQRLRETATDPGFARDVAAWCNMTGNRLIEVKEDGPRVVAVVEKQERQVRPLTSTDGNNATLIMFSDDLDKALAGFVLANGAASAGKEVTMFFTFWGLSIIKKEQTPPVRKDLMGRMFGSMLPKHSDKLSLSKMNFGGLGSSMMKARMKSKNVDALEKMMANARSAGVRFVACQMSMDIMGVDAEELLDGVEIGGVATYMDAASSSGVNLFV